MILQPNCSKRRCLHFLGVRNDGNERTERVHCQAFLEEIPDAIAYGDNSHLKPYPGDNGIRFEKADA